MELPKKINPANIREAVVEVRYDSDLPFEVLVGIFFNALDDTYTYTNRPLQQQLAMQGLPVNPTVSNLFYNEKLSIQLMPSSFAFTWLNQYSGWNEYQSEIVKALEQLMATGRVKKIIRIGLRYISEYPEKDLRECFKFTFSFGLPHVESETTAFRSEFIDSGTRIILNLNNKVPFFKPNPTTKQLESIRTSIMDIDVIKENLSIAGLQELVAAIEDNHSKEKKIFFGMMNPDYLASLNPEY